MDKMKDLRYEDLDIRISMGNMLINILSISYESPRPLWEYGNHLHSTYELHFIPSGKGLLKAMDNRYIINPDTFYLTGPGVVHQQKADFSDPMSEYCINFEVKILKRSSKKSDTFLSEEINEIINILHNTTFWFGKDEFEAGLFFNQLMQELQNSFTGCYTYVQNLLSLIILSAVRCMSQPKINSHLFPKKILNDSRIFVIDESFNKNYVDITPDILSKKIGTSQRQLNRIMKQHYNMTFTEKLLITRIERANELLRDTQLSIKEISERIGFGNPNYLSRVFQNYNGMSPTEFRKKRTNLHKFP